MDGVAKILGARIALTAGFVAILGVSSCSSVSGGAGGDHAARSGKGSGEGSVNIVATTTQICDYVSGIAQPAAEAEDSVAFMKTDGSGNTTKIGASNAATTLNLTCLLAPNASAHDHEMTVKQMSALGEADILMVNGVDLEHFLDDAVSSSGFSGTMLVTTGVLSANDQQPADNEYQIDQGNKKVEVARWPFPPEEEGGQPEFQYDPHVWTSPKHALVQATNIGDKLAAEDPVFEKYATDYENRLLELDQWVRDSIATVPEENRVLFTSHDAFGYFSSMYGVKFIGAALSDFNEQQDATADHIRAAADEVKNSGAKALFAENSNNSKSIEAIAKAAGVKAIVGEDALYGDSLGPDGSPGETYIGSIVHNVSTMVTAWGGTPAPLPADINSAE